MQVDMHCSCDCSFSIDADTDESVWFLTFRFANQHVACGYMTSATSEDPPPKKRIIKARRTGEDAEP